MPRLCTCGLFLLAAAAPLSAQTRAPEWRSWRAPSLDGAQSPQPARSTSTAGLVLAGLGGGTVGAFAGGVLGWQLGGGNDICGDDSCGLAGAAYGALIGETTLLPLAIHLANHRHGNYWLSLLASAGISVAGILAVDAANAPGPLIGVPVAQIISSILIERATAH
ncbi:MAG: hypothetical protein ABI742_05065 [Gemmatimonadota bacterium]